MQENYKHKYLKYKLKYLNNIRSRINNNNNNNNRGRRINNQ